MYRDSSGANNHNGTNNGVRLCGFDNTSVLQLLDAAHKAGVLAEQRVEQQQFGTHTNLNEYSRSSIVALVAAASREFNAAMLAVCPSDPQYAFQALQKSLSFQKEWMPEASIDELSQAPFVTGTTTAYHNAERKESKLAILSLFAPYYPYRVTESIFSCDHNDVHKARLHAAEGMAGVQLERLRHRRFKMDPQNFRFKIPRLRVDCARPFFACSAP